MRPPRPADLYRSIVARIEFRVLALLLVAFGGLLGFVEILGEVGEGDVAVLDRSILLWFRDPADLARPVGPPWLEIAFTELTALGGTTVLTLITALVVLYLLIDRKPAAAAFVVVSIGGGTLIGYGLKLLVQRPRPDVVAHLVDVHTASFPSGHAMMSAVTYITLAALLARVQARRRMRAYLIGIAVFMTLAIGMSRVYLGVHWPTDVIAGWCAGVSWALVCWVAAVSLQRRGSLEPARDESP